MPTLSCVITPFFTIAAVLFLNRYLAKYLEAKAQNMATKEDVKDIQTKIGEVNHLFNAELEKIKAKISIEVFEINNQRNEIRKNILELVSSIIRFENEILVAKRSTSESRLQGYIEHYWKVQSYYQDIQKYKYVLELLIDNCDTINSIQKYLEYIANELLEKFRIFTTEAINAASTNDVSKEIALITEYGTFCTESTKELMERNKRIQDDLKILYVGKKEGT